jgi:hypothetical protein
MLVRGRSAAEASYSRLQLQVTEDYACSPALLYSCMLCACGPHFAALQQLQQGLQPTQMLAQASFIAAGVWLGAAACSGLSPSILGMRMSCCYCSTLLAALVPATTAAGASTAGSLQAKQQQWQQHLMQQEHQLTTAAHPAAAQQTGAVCQPGFAQGGFPPVHCWQWATG